MVLGDDDETRVGYYDDDDVDDKSGQLVAVVYFCEPPFLFDTRYVTVPHGRLVEVDTQALLRRRDRLFRLLFEANNEWAATAPKKRSPVHSYRLLLEYSFVSGLLADRMFAARGHEGDRGGRRVFISHSSTDKSTAISLAVDLANRGHVPWLDEWEIKAGESIPLKISEGLEQSDYVIVLMSRVAVESGWVQAEWTAKYWDEIGARRVRIIPALLEDCTIPMLLKGKKYADLRTSYRDGLDQILDAIG